MTRKECLDAAAACVLKDRNCEYGGPEDSFGVIANFWSVYLGRKVYPADVAMMMAMLKIARIKGNQGYADGYVDLAGYAACGAECADGKPAPKAEGREEQEFRHGEKVSALLPGIGWCKATYLRELKDGEHQVLLNDGYAYDAKICHHAPKAEGCEALVEHDAPQTPEETCQRIVDNNPATYERPCKPTGEELAEMAEEEGNA